MILLLFVGPGGFGHGFESENAHTLLLCFLENLRTEIGLREKDEVDGEKNGVEIVAVHGGERGFDGVRRETDEADFAFLARGFEGFHGAVGGEDLVELGHFGEGVELVEVEVFGAQSFQRALEFLARAVTSSFLRFAGEKTAGAVGLERGAEAILRVAVAGGDIEIVDAATEGFGDEIVSGVLSVVHDGDAAEGDDGEVDAGFAERTLGDGVLVGGCVRERSGTEKRGGGSGFQEIATVHGAPCQRNRKSVLGRWERRKRANARAKSASIKASGTWERSSRRGIVRER